MRFVGVGRALAQAEVDAPVPGPGEALVRVRAVGLCGSDLHILEGHTPTASTPLTLGHEIAGSLERLTGTAPRASEGDRVFVNPMVGCGACRLCGVGDRALCPRKRILGIHLDGGLAEYVVAPLGNVWALPASMDFAAIAMIESASTAHRALRIAGVSAGQAVMVIGAGGLGIQAVRMAKAAGAHVVAVDTDESKRALSMSAGADAAMAPADGDIRERARAAGMEGDGMDAVIDCVGIPQTFALALEVLAPGGRAAVVGIGEQPLTLTRPAHFVRRGLQVGAVYGYTDEDIAGVIALAVSGRLDLAASVSATVSLGDVNRGLEMFASRTSPLTRVVVEV